MAPVVRALEHADVAAVQAAEVAAGRRFAEVGMGAIAEDDPTPADDLLAAAGDGRAWVATDDAGRPVGFVLAEVLDGNGHVEEVAVHPDHQGRGLATALLDQVTRWAGTCGFGAVTLTTFRDVPWNGPYYLRRGFRVLDPDEVGPELAARRAEEAERGLDPDLRVCMARPVPADASDPR